MLVKIRADIWGMEGNTFFKNTISSKACVCRNLMCTVYFVYLSLLVVSTVLSSVIVQRNDWRCGCSPCFLGEFLMQELH